MATKLERGGGIKALVAGPLKKDLYCGFPKIIFFLLFLSPCALFSFSLSLFVCVFKRVCLFMIFKNLHVEGKKFPPPPHKKSAHFSMSILSLSSPWLVNMAGLRTECIRLYIYTVNVKSGKKININNFFFTVNYS